MHHLDSWIKIDRLDVTCFFISLLNAQHVSNVSTSILRSLRLICWVISCVVLWWYPYASFSLHKDTTPPQPNHTVTPTHIEPEQYNTWNNSTNKSQAPKDGCTNIRNMLSISNEIKKQVASCWSIFIQLTKCFSMYNREVVSLPGVSLSLHYGVHNRNYFRGHCIGISYGD